MPLSASAAKAPPNILQDRGAGPPDPSDSVRACIGRGKVIHPPGQPRLWPVDALRGIAVAAMVGYHFLWDLSFFGLYPADVTRGAWQLFARAVATTFLLLVGVSMSLAATRRPPPVCARQWRARGLKLWGWALVISLVTRWALGHRFVLFGILHLIGTAFLLAPLWWRWRRLSGILGVALVAAGQVVRRIPVEVSWLIPLGLTPADYETVDYFPVLPWLGVVLIGLYLEQRMDLGHRPLVEGPPSHPLSATPPRWLQPACLLGRHSLLVYLIHQPILLLGFWMFGHSIW